MTTQTASKNIRFGHSPDPDDAFMFYAFAYEKIPMRGFKVEHVIEDIESLNQRALKNAELEVTAVSCHAYAHLADKYVVMRSGSSMGSNYGPILVSKSPGHQVTKSPEIKGKRIAIPGKLTTAYLAMQLYEKDFIPVFTPFDQIFEAVESGKVDFGLIIHEGQITFEEKGFEKILDLGEWWHEKHNLPLPLGVDVIRRDLGRDTMKEFALLFKESIQYALDNRQPALQYAKKYGRGISDELNDRFVGMYVNDLTVDLGPRGEKGFQTLLDEAFAQGLIPQKIKLEFV
jgi:1,4-dihydroxy-6-naphthoate synthase